MVSYRFAWFDLTFVELVLAAVKGRVSEKQYETGSPNRSFGTCGNLQSEILQTRSIRGHQHVVPTVVFYLLEKNLTVLCSSKEDMCKISLFLYWNHLPLAKTYSVASTIRICVVLETISTGWDNQLMLLFSINHRDGSELEAPIKKNPFVSIFSRWLESVRVRVLFVVPT